MKTDRLIGIIATLQQEKNVTAPYLAEKFEVSRRTISRDIETLCMAGIPIVTTRGAHGGVALMEGFALDTTVFTKQELAAVFAGLQSVDSVSRNAMADMLAKKIGGDAVHLADAMLIDLSSFYKADLTEKIELIKNAIRDSVHISFHYCSAKGESDRIIEPYLIVFRWSDWYVFGYCTERQDFRLYKLRRLWNLQRTKQQFTPRAVPKEKKQFGSNMTDDYFVSAVYAPEMKYRLVEEYGPYSFTVLPDGKLFTRWGFSTAESAVAWFLGFGNRVKVVDPPEIVEKMRKTLHDMEQLYES